MSSRGTIRRGASARSGRLHRSHQTRTPKSPRKKTTPAATPTTTPPKFGMSASANRSEEHTSELQSRLHLVCRLLLEKKKNQPREEPQDVVVGRDELTPEDLGSGR